MPRRVASVMRRTVSALRHPETRTMSATCGRAGTARSHKGMGSRSQCGSGGSPRRISQAGRTVESELRQRTSEHGKVGPPFGFRPTGVGLSAECGSAH